MRTWNEIRTAAMVARFGTVSAAAQELGVHRATVNRHIEALEQELGAKLFLRHKRGFTPTPLGLELLRIAEKSSNQFNELVRLARYRSEALDGQFTVTTVEVLMPVILPILTAFRRQYPNVELRVVGCDRILKLEHGEADVAIRIGPKPDAPDDVVIPITRLKVGFFGPPGFRMPPNLAGLPDRSIIGPGDGAPATTYFRWMRNHIADRAIGFRSNSIPVLWDAVKHGYGIGFLPHHLARGQALVELLPAVEEWHEPVWLVTHVDMHRSGRNQAFVRAVRETEF